MTQLPPQIPPRPEQTPQTAQGTVASEESLTRNRFSATRGLYVLALLIGFALTLFAEFAVSPLAESLSFFFLIAVLVGVVYLIWRSFRPGAERITLGRALIATALVPAGTMLFYLAYVLLPSSYRVDPDGNDWGGFMAIVLLVLTMPAVAAPLVVGMSVRQREKLKTLAVEHSLVTGVPVPETSPGKRLFFGALAVGAFLLTLFWFWLTFADTLRSVLSLV